MRIYSALQIGEYHINHCEDYLFIGDIGPRKIICAVMDGCTMATDSYLASTLVGKLLRKIAKEKSYKEFYQSETFTGLDDQLRSIVGELFNELNIVKNQLMLEKNELLTTLILLLIDKKEKQGIVLAIGDGLVCINGQRTEFNQDNKPDYLGFHLSEDFDKWYDSQKQKISFNSVHDISIATDGITMFSPVREPGEYNIPDPVDYLLSDTTNSGNEDMLHMKLKTLEHTFGLKPTDDIAMIRILA